jgi:hypothetical protein
MCIISMLAFMCYEVGKLTSINVVVKYLPESSKMLEEKDVNNSGNNGKPLQGRSSNRHKKINELKCDVIRLPHSLQQKFLTLQKSLRIKTAAGVLNWFFSTFEDRIEAEIAEAKENCTLDTKWQSNTGGSASRSMQPLDLNVPLSENNEVRICNIVCKNPYIFTVSKLCYIEFVNILRKAAANLIQSDKETRETQLLSTLKFFVLCNSSVHNSISLCSNLT